MILKKAEFQYFLEREFGIIPQFLIQRNSLNKAKVNIKLY